MCKKTTDVELPKVDLIKRKRNLREVLEEETEIPPSKKQKVESPAPLEFPNFDSTETEVFTYETEAEYSARIKDEQIETLKVKNQKLKKQLEDKDEIIKVLTQQLAAASKKSEAKYNIEVPLNFGVLNCS